MTGGYLLEIEETSLKFAKYQTGFSLANITNKTWNENFDQVTLDWYQPATNLNSESSGTFIISIKSTADPRKIETSILDQPAQLFYRHDNTLDDQGQPLLTRENAEEKLFEANLEHAIAGEHVVSAITPSNKRQEGSRWFLVETVPADFNERAQWSYYFIIKPANVEGPFIPKSLNDEFGGEYSEYFSFDNRSITDVLREEKSEKKSDFDFATAKEIAIAQIGAEDDTFEYNGRVEVQTEEDDGIAKLLNMIRRCLKQNIVQQLRQLPFF